MSDGLSVLLRHRFIAVRDLIDDDWSKQIEGVRELFLKDSSKQES